MINNEELIVNTVIDFKVMVRCLTFNHASYITEAMNGFCMQQTSFPFVCTIVDDASMDGEQDVIRDYLNKHFDLNDPVISRNEETDDYMMIFARHKTNQHCYFAIYLLKYNHRSIKKAKALYLKKWTEQVKYIALCEGDDYWTDPLKLQKQVDFLESHPDYTMVCNRTKLYSEKQKKYVGENYCYNHDRTVKTKDVIYRSGLFISTCSIVYRRSIVEKYPDYCRKCAVGDYPLQIMAAMMGKIYYFNEIMSVYRVENSNSWMKKQKWRSVSDSNLNRIDSMINMFKGFSLDFPNYKSLYNNKIAQYLIFQSPSRFTNEGKDLEFFKDYYRKDFHEFPLFFKIIEKFRMTNIRGLRGYSEKITRHFLDHFTKKIFFYK